MTITIGERTFAISRPGDFDQQLVEATGCSTAEHAAALARPSTGFQIARVLAPMLADNDLSVGALAELIDASDRDAVRAQAVALLHQPEQRGKKVKGAGDGQA
jgi:alkyl hydroperoxide reductase subunit AhpC